MTKETGGQTAKKRWLAAIPLELEDGGVILMYEYQHGSGAKDLETEISK